ncbi:fatty acid desaturase [bacterium]|nr:fatty acid desaturase [bacterium]
MSSASNQNRTRTLEKILWPRFILFPVLAIAAYPFFIMGIGGETWYVQTGWVLFLTYCWFCVGGAFHETVHETLFKNGAINRWYGRVLGWMVGIPYTVYRESHRRHHAYLNTPDDYELWPYSDPSTSLWFRRSFLWIDLLFGVVTAPHIYGRIFLNNDPRLSKKVRRTILLEYLALLVYWALALSVIFYFLKKPDGTYHKFQWIWILPLVLSPMVNTARKFVEHLGMQSTNPVLGTRTVVSNNWIESWLGYFNFDIAIHGPHHRYPKARHYELEAKLVDCIEKHPEEQVPVFSSYLTAFIDSAKCFWNAPQTGSHLSGHTTQVHSESVEAQNWESNEVLMQESSMDDHETHQ